MNSIKVLRAILPLLGAVLLPACTPGDQFVALKLDASGADLARVRREFALKFFVHDGLSKSALNRLDRELGLETLLSSQCSIGKASEIHFVICDQGNSIGIIAGYMNPRGVLHLDPVEGDPKDLIGITYKMHRSLMDRLTAALSAAGAKTSPLVASRAEVRGSPAILVW